MKQDEKEPVFPCLMWTWNDNSSISSPSFVLCKSPDGKGYICIGKHTELPEEDNIAVYNKPLYFVKNISFKDPRPPVEISRD